MDIFIGLVVVALILLGVYLVTHHKAPATPSGADLANTLAASGAAAWDAIKRDLPAIVSAELAQANTALDAAEAEAAALKARLEAALAANAAQQQAHEAELATQQQAQADALAAQQRQHEAALAAVADRVAKAVTASPELQPAPDAAAAPA